MLFQADIPYKADKTLEPDAIKRFHYNNTTLKFLK